MLPCYQTLASADHSFVSVASQGHSADNTPTSSVQISPRINLTREFSHALQSKSFVEIRRIITENFSYEYDFEEQLGFDEYKLVEQFLRPSRDSAQDAVLLIKIESFADLIGEYFDQSENALRLCIVVYQRMRHARRIYQTICDACGDIPSEFEWDRLKNPFSSLESDRFDSVCSNFNLLRIAIVRFKRSKSKQHLSKDCCSCISCGISCKPLRPLRHERVKGRQHNASFFSQAEIAEKGAFFVQNHLNTIYCLVSSLDSAVEVDKDLIRHLRLGNGEDMDRYSIQEALNHLQINWPSFDKKLLDLENHLFLCFSEVNKTRVRLLHEIQIQSGAV